MIWELSELHGGFRNISGAAGLVATAAAEARWSAGVDKTLKLVPQKTLLNFKVGAVPFALFFAVPMEVKADASFDATASATFGATANLELGDATISWTLAEQWTFTKPAPKLSSLPMLGATAAVTGSASLALSPSFQMHFDRVFSYTLAASPVLQSTLTGSAATKQACIDSSYTFAATSAAELDINIPALNIHKDISYGPTTIATSEGEVLKKCVKL